jgi:hypothetical protein
MDELAYISDHLIGFILEADFCFPSESEDGPPADWKRRLRREKILHQYCAINLIERYITINDLTENHEPYQSKVDALILKWFGPGTPSYWQWEGMPVADDEVEEMEEGSFLEVDGFDPARPETMDTALNIVIEHCFIPTMLLSDELQANLEDPDVVAYHQKLRTLIRYDGFVTDGLAVAELERTYAKHSAGLSAFTGTILLNAIADIKRRATKPDTYSVDFPILAPVGAGITREAMISAWEARNGKIEY